MNINKNDLEELRQMVEDLKKSRERFDKIMIIPNLVFIGLLIWLVVALVTGSVSR